MYTMDEYNLVRRYERSLTAAYTSLTEMIADQDYRMLAETGVHSATLHLMFLMAKEIGYMESLKTEIANHIKNG